MATASEDVACLAKSQQRFTIDLYKEVSSGVENVVFCPTSICAALSMLGVGAKGDTASQVAEALRVPSVEASSEVHDCFKDLITAITLGNDDTENVVMKIANTLYMPVGGSFSEVFTNTLADKYFVTVQYADFANKSAEVANQINTWIANQTNNKITNMASADMFDQSTALVLINAVYMKGLWQKPFDRSKTSSQPFNLLDGSSRQVDMMHQLDKFKFGHSKSLNCAILEMLYMGSEFAMDIILPHSAATFQTLENSLDMNEIEKLLHSMHSPSYAIVFVPRFQAEVFISLHDVLPKLGIVDMFCGGKANFSAIAGGSLCVSKLLHKTFIVVDEEGSEAGATTMAFMQMSMPFEFRVDHPFFYLIRHIKTGAILFIGRVTDPPESSS